jgi:inorganic pyrophosphatase
MLPTFLDSKLNHFSTNLTVKQSASRVSPDQLDHIPGNQEIAPAPIDPSIDKWFFISGAAA